uniref:Uncharacterized protein n=3 Tax=Babesia bovis TaxID=5865 RepID=A7AW33_BABBO|eukprot:XP_001608829.1 hypothetical protein [Babesia bovis T2Bo]
MMRSRAVTPIGQTSNTQNDALDRKIALLKRQHEREVIAAKQQVLDQVDVLVKKYRQLAIDAVRVARDEQHKAEQERRNAYEACARYEADLMTNVRNAIAQLKVSNKAEHERLLAERDALQRRCQDLMPSNTLNGPALDRITAKIISQFHDNQKFNMDLIDDSVDMILKEYVTFQKMAADLMIKKFATRGCTLTNDDATEFVDKAVAVNGLEL